jgi:hypothetical protein
MSSYGGELETAKLVMTSRGSKGSKTLLRVVKRCKKWNIWKS